MTIPGIPRDRDIPDFDLPDIDPTVVFNTLRADVPLLMLPVRLETRFYHNPERLRVRIYPDQIHVNDYQAALSEIEAKLGQQVWEQIKRLGDRTDPRVFEPLAKTLGVRRAAWVLEATKPVDVTNGGKGKPAFPKLDTGRDPAAPARFALLPRRWFVIGFLQGKAMFTEHGEPIPDELRFAPFQLHDGGEAERWMVDFDLALQLGMALEIHLNGDRSAVATKGLDELIVVGARFDDPAAEAASFEDLLRGHYYTHGFDFVPQGTPTNNTEGVPSPWSRDAVDPRVVFERAWQASPASSDGFRSRFASALGLDVNGIVARAVHADSVDIPTMRAMNAALWYTTWGEYLRFVLHDGDKAPISDDDIDWLRDWFTDHVRGGAVYPAFQIGAMPYGVLPVQLQPVPNALKSPDDYVKTVLHKLRAGWERSLGSVPHLDPTATASSTDAPITTDLEAEHDNLIELLSSHPHPARFFTRNLYNLRNPAYDLDLLILLGLIADPVDRIEALQTVLLEHMFEVDANWNFITYAQLQTPFASLADQIGFFENIAAGLDARADDLQDQINALTPATGPISLDKRDEINALIDKRNLVQITIPQVLDVMLDTLNTHAARVFPLNDLGLPPLMDAVSEATPNPEHFLFTYKQTVTEWGDLPLVQADNATGNAAAAGYLAWLRDYARGDVSGTAPDGMSDPAPLLFQLIKRAIDRAKAWNNSVLVELDNILQELDNIGRLNSPTSRINATQRLISDERRLNRTATLLNQTLRRDEQNPLRRSVGSVPRQIYQTAANQLKEYQRVTQKASQELTRLIDALDEWIKTPTGSPLPISGGMQWIAAPTRGREAQLAAHIELLIELPPDQLELRLRETLGLAMHRLDAWITAYAEQRIADLRAKTPVGVQIGGYGWVENLRPDAAGTAPSQGYIHAPSMTHAATAAILRSGYSAYSDGTSTSPLSVDLRSERVRVASWLMDGVRQEQRINDLLGYRFERALHDTFLDVWIAPIRAIVAEHGTTELSSSNSVVTVDGLALLELWDEGDGALKGLIQANPPVDAQGSPLDFNAIIPALESLVWATDAMADLALAESVHALVEGDYERASAVQNASAFGDVPPPEPRSILTPNSGVTITQRIVLLPQGDGSSWQGKKSSVRAAQEPTLEAWAAAIIGAPDRVRFDVRAGESDPVGNFTLADLPVSALDAIYLAPLGERLDGSGLAEMIAYVYRQQFAGSFDTTQPIIINADTAVQDGQISLAEFMLLAKPMHKILGGARAAMPGDFILGAGTDTDAAGVQVDELAGRASALLREFEEAAAALDGRQLPLETALLRLSYFNLPEAIPASSLPEALIEQAVAMRMTVNERLKRTRQAYAPIRREGSQPVGRLRSAKNVIAAVLGRDFPTIPRFTLPAPVFRDESAVTGKDRRGVMGWLLKLARVRPELTDVRELITASEALQDRALFDFWVAQFPHVEGELWAGVASPGDAGGDRLSVVVTANGRPADSGTAAGLVLDEWIEHIPTDYEMTGLAFHYDAPTSRPPQALLLAVPPVGTPWSFDLVRDTVREAFALARLRAVAPETLGEYGHHLPAVFFSSDLDTIGAPDAE